jgi:hypothetical protein
MNRIENQKFQVYKLGNCWVAMWGWRIIKHAASQEKAMEHVLHHIALLRVLGGCR